MLVGGLGQGNVTPLNELQLCSRFCRQSNIVRVQDVKQSDRQPRQQLIDTQCLVLPLQALQSEGLSGRRSLLVSLEATVWRTTRAIRSRSPADPFASALVEQSSCQPHVDGDAEARQMMAYITQNPTSIEVDT